MSDPRIKVNDRRLFNAAGELRDEYRHLEGGAQAAPRPAAPQPAAPQPAAPQPAAPPQTMNEPAAPQPAAPPQTMNEPAAPPQTMNEPAAPQPAAPQPPAEIGPDEFGGATFFDLLGLVANPVPIFLEQARYATGPEAAENLEMARLHVDLLGVLRKKTAGNLTAQEQATLDDVVYRLRMGFVGR